MSETSAFRHEATPGPVHPNRAGIGFVYAGDAVPLEQISDAYAERQTTVTREIRARPMVGTPRGFGLYWAHYSDRSAASATLGLGVAGADLTQHVGGRNYVSASGSALGGAQLSVMHRALNVRRAGMLVGAATRLSTYALDTNAAPCSDTGPYGCESSALVWVPSVGARSTVLLRSDVRGRSGEVGQGLLGTLYVGYAPGIGEPIITFGASVGKF